VTRTISVIIPARNEAPLLAATIEGIAEARASKTPVEFVIVDDASTDGCATQLRDFAKHRVGDTNVRVRVLRLDKRIGVPQARNLGAMRAAGDVLVITDAHVGFTPGWDEIVREHVRKDRILAATITQENTDFCGYGCRLAVPLMGTYWNKEPIDQVTAVQIAACSGTALSKELFLRLGGYDSGMLLYGSAEPEFSVRAWLEGYEVIAVPQFLVQHRFKPQDDRERFVAEVRPYMLHNSIRFGLLYLSELGALQLLAYFARRFPELIQGAIRRVLRSDVWKRRSILERQRLRPFEWFVRHFSIKDVAGREVL
jgi:glycosyltransferase involved in cell wall biosynthesis